jgi:hypothetical protein
MPDDESERKRVAEKAAHAYAWRWFKYHAAQRQAVFRFYVVMSGAISTGYLATQNSADLKAISFVFGFLLAMLSLFFWRLDVRSIVLIKLAEEYLKISERNMAATLNTPVIELATRADSERNTRFFGWCYSFRQVYRWVFFLVGLMGAAVFALGMVKLIVRYICPA